uniref:Reverse transcriptase domain-containing protein n=1 Tax=Tanacetum cinerariifolium TaxID=118510 RepID=A0A699IKQ9_TANCI|nr:hypothetical protein [Tanacetum cinerariifolium]
MLRTKLKKVQVELDEDRNNSTLREIEIVFNSVYREAALDEERDDIGNEFHDEEVTERFVDHFQSFLRTSKQTFPIDMPEDLFKNKVNPKSALHMIKEVFKDEVKVALFDIEDDKAPRPDGFTSKFFKAS